MAKRNIRVKREVVFAVKFALSVEWRCFITGYVYDTILLRWVLKYFCSSLDNRWDIRPFVYISSIKLLSLYIKSVRRTLSFRNILLVLGKQTRAIFLWTKPFYCEKLNKRDFQLLSLAQLLCNSLCLSLNLADCRDVLSPDLFSNGSRSSASRSDLLKLPISSLCDGILFSLLQTMFTW